MFLNIPILYLKTKYFLSICFTNSASCTDPNNKVYLVDMIKASMIQVTCNKNYNVFTVDEVNQNSHQALTDTRIHRINRTMLSPRRA